MFPKPEGKSSPSPTEIQSWLEWAGERMLSLKVNGTKPSSFRSFWPDYADDPRTAYGYNGVNIRFPFPSNADISLMDEILDLILLIPSESIRRIVQLRSLILPTNHRHANSWGRIAEKLRSSPQLVKIRYRYGIQTIVDKIPTATAHKIRTILT